MDKVQQIFAIGNGESRASIDLRELPKLGKIVGCNALYRGLPPDFLELLVVSDSPVIEEVSKSYRGKIATVNKATNKAKISDSEELVDLPNLKLGQGQWLSGVAALYLICKLYSPKLIYMLGYDNCGRDGKINNVFKGTENYFPPNTDAKIALGYRLQSEALQKIMETFPNILFIRVVDKWVSEIKILDNRDNYITMSIRDFKKTFKL